MPAKVDNEKCTGCETCVDECPSDAISMAEEKAVIDVETCIDCGACVDVCPVEAISME
ncbi:MAG: indolepyruvate ferredoxin oxidoreductase subunit alpha [Planctomycetota bacterium]|jgi:ferredoxin